MIYGLVKPDSATMALHGDSYTQRGRAPPGPSGVAMVFQHLSLFEALSVAENIGARHGKPPQNARAKATRSARFRATLRLPLDS